MMQRCLMPHVLFFAMIIVLALPLPGRNQTLNLENLGKQFGVDGKIGRLLDKSIRVIQAIAPIAYNEEKAIGGALAVEAFQRFGGPYQGPQLIRYVSLVGLSVATHSNRPDIPYHFAILNSREPNAFAIPGGYVFVTIGLLSTIQSESELAGILGHEIAHIAQKHALDAIHRNQALKGIGELTMTAMNKDPRVLDKVVAELSRKIFEEGFDQNLEFESDRIGSDYAFRVGYNPIGLQRILKRLAQIDQDGGPSGKQ